MASIFQDIRYAARNLRRASGFTIAAIGTLAPAIGATVAIISLLIAVVLRPLPYVVPEQLVYVDSQFMNGDNAGPHGVTEAAYFFLRDNNSVFEEIGAYGGDATGQEFTIVQSHGGLRVNGAWVTASLFDVFRVRPHIGRLFSSEDDRPGIPSVAVLGYEYWLREYGGDRSIIGSSVELEGGLRLEVVGVLEPGVHMPQQRVDVWLPLGLNPDRRPDTYHGYGVIGRLRPGVTLKRAAQDLTRMTSRLPEAMPQVYTPQFLQESGFTTRATWLTTHVSAGIGRALWIVVLATFLMLLIAFANVANLFLVRAEDRRGDRTVRLALGASRRRLAHEIMAEALLITLAAGAVGTWLANSALRILVSAGPAELRRFHINGIPLEGLVWAVTLAILAGIGLGASVLLRTSPDESVLRGGSRGATPEPGKLRTMEVLVGAQIAVAVILLSTGGLLYRTFDMVRSVHPGFEASGALAVEVFLPGMADRYRKEAGVIHYYRDLMSRLEALPGVRAVGFGTWLPLKDESTCVPVFLQTSEYVNGGLPPCIATSAVTPNYFRALGIPLTGRELRWREPEQSGGEIVITQNLAQRLWPGESAIGRTIGIRNEEETFLIVGVANDMRGNGLNQPPPEVIFRQLQWGRATTLIVRTEGEPTAAQISRIRNEIVEIDPAVAIGAVSPMSNILTASPFVARTSFLMRLLSVAAVLGISFSAVGLFGVLAYTVAKRHTEIGLRMALGAEPSMVAALVARRSLKVAMIGLVLGLAGTLSSGSLIRSMLYGVAPHDPVTLLGVVILVLTVVTSATYLPARRAAKVEPASAMRFGGDV